MVYKINAGKVSRINDHYRPQYTFCGLAKYLNHFNFIIYYDKESVANQTYEFMENAGIDIDRYYYNWGEYHNETMFVSKVHPTSKMSKSTLDDKIAFYSKFYSKKLAEKALSVFDTDYKTFKFPYPEWLEYL